MSEYNIHWELHNMIAAPAGVATPYIMYKSEDGILMSYGITKPADAAEGYAPGSIFIHVDGTDGSALYVNEGTVSSADFNLITVAAA
jgi:hypothetical protein